MTLNLKGKVSWFGGPNDTGVSPSEGLAFIYDVDDAPHLFLSLSTGRHDRTGAAAKSGHLLSSPPVGTMTNIPKDYLLTEMAMVRSPKTGKQVKVYPADWGPHVDTNRVADVSPAVMEYLGIKTDDEVEVIFPFTHRHAPQAKPISAHLHVIWAFHHMPRCSRYSE